MSVTFIGHKLHYTCDTEADIDMSWEVGSQINVTGSNKHYVMCSGSQCVAMNYGSYNDLSNLPSSAQLQSDWAQANILLADFIKNKPGLLKTYFGTILRNDAVFFTKSATVASGVAVFQVTDTGLAGSNPLFPNGPNDDSVNLYVSDSSASYQMSHAWSNSNKTLTVTCNKLTTSNILTGILGQAQGNGAVIHLTVWGR